MLNITNMPAASTSFELAKRGEVFMSDTYCPRCGAYGSVKYEQDPEKRQCLSCGKAYRVESNASAPLKPIRTPVYTRALRTRRIVLTNLLILLSLIIGFAAWQFWLESPRVAITAPPVNEWEATHRGAML